MIFAKGGISYAFPTMSVFLTTRLSRQLISVPARLLFFSLLLIVWIVYPKDRWREYF